MAKGNGWIPLDKNLAQELPYDRPYTRLEAMFSHTKDIDDGKEWSINGYAKLWQWSRDKVRRFIRNTKTADGHQADRYPTPSRQPIHYIDKALWEQKNSKPTASRQQADSRQDTTIYPNPKPNPKKKDIPEKKEFSEEVISLANIFADTLPKRLWPDNGKKEKWLDTLDKCIRIDGYTYEQIKEIILTYRNDNFWQSNFLSPAKLRKNNNDGVKYIHYFFNKMETKKHGNPTNQNPEQLANRAEQIYKNLTNQTGS